MTKLPTTELVLSDAGGRRPILARISAALSRAFAQPLFAEALTADKLSALRTVHVALFASALFVDLGLFLTIGDVAQVDADAFNLLLTINVPLLAVGLLITLFLLREPGERTDMWQRLVVVIECITTIVWIQLSGSTSSYFILIALIMALGFRFLLDYKTTRTAIVLLFIGHLGIFAAEEMGLLARASLLVDGPGALYEIPAIRYAAIASVLLGYTLCFATGNTLLTALHSANASRRRAQSQLARVAAGVDQGRLTGLVLGGAYQLREVIGRGGMGEVYRASTAKSGESVAVKILHPHLATTKSVLARFFREAQAASRIPGAVAPGVHAVVADEDGENYIVMEYLQGEDLAAFLRRHGSIEPRRAVELITKIAQALDLTHEAGVIHRDLKPQNVFLEQSDGDGFSVRLLDFGIAKLLELSTTLTEANMLLGTPGFIAPEQAESGAADIGPEADIFALGAVAYQSLTGERPFVARSLVQALHLVANVDPVKPSLRVSGLPAKVDAVVLKALARRPQDRYQRAADFAAELAEAVKSAAPLTEAVDSAAPLASLQVVGGTLSDVANA